MVKVKVGINPYFSFLESVRELERALQQDLEKIIPAENGPVEFNIKYPQTLSRICGKTTITVKFNWPYSQPAAGFVAAIIMGHLCSFANAEPAMHRCDVIEVAFSSKRKSTSLIERRNQEARRFEYYQK